MSSRARGAVAGGCLAAFLATGVAAASFTAATGSAGNRFAAAPDFVAPTASATTLVKSEGGEPGFIRPGGQYSVYARVADTGAPASGTDTVTADAGSGRFGLPAGSFAFAGQAFTHRSGSQTAPANLAAGPGTLSLSLRDAAANVRAVTSGFIVDTQRPAPMDVQTTGGGVLPGRPDAGDSITFTFSEPIDRESVIGGWTAADDPRPVVVRIDDGGLFTDSVRVFDAANATPLVALGTTDLGSGGYVLANRTYGLTGATSRISRVGNGMQVVLGTPSGAASPLGALFTTSLTWTPSSVAFDRAGNPATSPTITEGGLLDQEF